MWWMLQDKNNQVSLTVAFRSLFLGTTGDGYNSNNTSASIQEKDQLMKWNIMCRMFVSLTIYVFLVYISLSI